MSKYVLPPLDLGTENADEEYLDRNYSLIDQFMEKVYPFKEEENRATAKLQLPDNIIVETFMHEIETQTKPFPNLRRNWTSWIFGLCRKELSHLSET